MSICLTLLRSSKQTDPSNSRDDSSYPRPDFRRINLLWQSLNRTWEFNFDDKDIGLSQDWPQSSLASLPNCTTSETQVPFVFQSQASGINERGVHEVLWYQNYLINS